MSKKSKKSVYPINKNEVAPSPSNSKDTVERIVKIASSHKKSVEKAAKQEAPKEAKIARPAAPKKAEADTQNNPFRTWEENFKEFCNLTTNGYQDPSALQDAAFSFSLQGIEGLSEAMDANMKLFQDSVEASRDSIEAIVASGQTLTQGIEAAHDEMMRFSNQLFADNVEVCKDFFSCRTANDAIALQNNAIQSTMQSYMQAFNKINEIALQCMANTTKHSASSKH